MACGLIYERVFDRGINRAGDNYVSKVTGVHFESFLEGWLSCLAELSVPKDNPEWTKVVATLEFPEPPCLIHP